MNINNVFLKGLMSINNAPVMLGAEPRALCSREYPTPELCTQHFFVLVFDFLKRSCLFSFGQDILVAYHIFLPSFPVQSR